MPLTPVDANEANISRAAAHLRDGRLVAFPTETVYGLGADARNGQAVARIFAAKGRPTFNPLIVHVADVVAARDLVELTPAAERLAEAFWPGGLTLVLDKHDAAGIADLVSAGLSSLAIRVPAHPVASAVLHAARCPVAAPSANRSGRVSATTAAHVAGDIDEPALAMILDAGPCPLGIESTIVDARGDVLRLLRPGAVTLEAMQAVLRPGLRIEAGVLPTAEAGSARSSPGQLESHYAPAKDVFLDVTAPAPDQALLAFGSAPGGHRGVVINLSARGDLTEAAANLFSGLRQLDASTAASIAVMPIPNEGLGLAINDRLRRAAAPRPATAPD